VANSDLKVECEVIVVEAAENEEEEEKADENVEEKPEDKRELPEFTIDPDEMSLELGSDWEKYQVSYCADNRIGNWYNPNTPSMPMRVEGKIYLEDIPAGPWVGTYMFVRDKTDLNLGYRTMQVPKSTRVKITSTDEVQKFASNFEPGERFKLILPNGEADGYYWESGNILELKYSVDGNITSVIQLHIKEEMDYGMTMYGVEKHCDLLGAEYELNYAKDRVTLLFSDRGETYYSRANVEKTSADAQDFYNFFCYVLNNSRNVEIIKQEGLSDWQFAIVDRIHVVEENEEYPQYSQKIRLVMLDSGEKINFNLVSDDKKELNRFNGEGVIAFRANAKAEIKLENICEVTEEGNVPENFEVIEISPLDMNVVDFEAQRFMLDGKKYKVASDTTMIDAEEKCTITLDAFVNAKNGNVKVPVLLVVDEYANLMHIVALETPPVQQSLIRYGLVLDSTYTASKLSNEVLLLGIDGKEYIYEYNASKIELEDGAFIGYITSDDKLELCSVRLNLFDAKEASDDENIGNKNKGAYIVESVEEDFYRYVDDKSVIMVNTDELRVVMYDNDMFTNSQFSEDDLVDNYVFGFDTNTDVLGMELLIVIK